MTSGYIATTRQIVTPQTEPLIRSPRKKITLPAMPVEDEISYNKPQQFTVSSDPPPRPGISSYLPRTPQEKQTLLVLVNSHHWLTPLFSLHICQRTTWFSQWRHKKTTAKQITSPCPLIPLWLPIPQPIPTSRYPQEKCLHQPLKISQYLQGRCHPRVPLKLKTQQ